MAESAVETARGFYRAGAKLLHMVDLDGALAGEGRNRSVVREVIEQVGIPVAVSYTHLDVYKRQGYCLQQLMGILEVLNNL